MPDLLIGCPVSQRQWIMPTWFRHVAEAADRVGVRPAFVFVGNPAVDSTFDVIADELELAQSPACTVVGTDEPARVDRRRWPLERVELMAELRNRMLAEVRRQEPELFLSLDSDVLLHSEALAALLGTAAAHPGVAAVGGRCYMQTGTKYPSWCRKGREGWVHGADLEGVVHVDAILAIKLMRPVAYNVDYRAHPWGEDVGWAEACAERSLRLMWDGRVVSKHVLSPQKLHAVDHRCSF